MVEAGVAEEVAVVVVEVDEEEVAVVVADHSFLEPTYQNIVIRMEHADIQAGSVNDQKKVTNTMQLSTTKWADQPIIVPLDFSGAGIITITT